MSYQNGDLEAEEASLISSTEAEEAPLISSTETNIKTPNRKILYLAAAAMTSIFVVAATMQSLKTSRIIGATNFAKVLYANEMKSTWGNWGNFSILKYFLYRFNGSIITQMAR